MSGNLHRKTDKPSNRDLQRNPGIGTSKGMVRGGDMLDEEPLDGESTFEGDVESDATPQGGIDPRKTGRTNE